jgi:N4-gp56 family major capsid protein
MVNLASKYSQKVDERFRLGSLTEAAVNRDYDWTGSHTLCIYSINTSQMNDYHYYTAYGSDLINSRYGNIAELENTKQDATVGQDRAFTFAIDKGNHQETQGAMKAEKALERQIEEVVIPEVDVYRLSVMSASAIANGQVKTEAITENNAYSSLLKAGEVFDDNKVPRMGRIAFVTSAFYTFLKLNDQFISASDIGQRMLIRGQVGEVDGTKIIMVPSIYMPANHAFILCHPLTTIAAEKLEEYKIHKNPVGINGFLVEGRVMYDTFISDNKKQGLYVHKTA